MTSTRPLDLPPTRRRRALRRLREVPVLPSLVTLGNLFFGFLAVSKVADALRLAQPGAPFAAVVSLFLVVSYLRVVAGGRQGFSYVGSLDVVAAAAALVEARDNAAHSTPDDANGLAVPDGVSPATLELHDPAIAALDSTRRIELALALGHAGADLRAERAEAGPELAQPVGDVLADADGGDGVGGPGGAAGQVRPGHGSDADPEQAAHRPLGQSLIHRSAPAWLSGNSDCRCR